jgi:hypothetical protein
MFGCMALIPIPPQCKRVFNYFILTIWLFAIKNNLAINKSHNCLPKKGLRTGSPVMVDSCWLPTTCEQQLATNGGWVDG